MTSQFMVADTTGAVYVAVDAGTPLAGYALGAWAPLMIGATPFASVGPPVFAQWDDKVYISVGVQSTTSLGRSMTKWTGTTATSFLTVYPSTSPRPTTSDLNWTAGVTVPNLVIGTLGTTGSISFYNAMGMTDVVVDLVGYFS
jgi:hypothetical protein